MQWILDADLLPAGPSPLFVLAVINKKYMIDGSLSSIVLPDKTILLNNQPKCIVTHIAVYDFTATSSSF